MIVMIFRVFCENNVDVDTLMLEATPESVITM